MSAHTPWPWVVKPIRHDSRGFRVREIHHRDETTSSGVHVEVHELGNQGSLQRLDADALLIAASPELLAMLKALEEQARQVVHGERSDIDGRLWTQTQALIAKAEGR